jgi:hypothetical protein
VDGMSSERGRADMVLVALLVDCDAEVSPRAATATLRLCKMVVV